MHKHAVRTLRAMVGALALWLPCAPVQAVYWNLINFEGSSSDTALWATYATRADMFTDSNRLGTFTSSGTARIAAADIVGTGSDGNVYWALFNQEGSGILAASYRVYPTLGDMFANTNWLGIHTITTPLASSQLVGTGSDGNVYWALFNSDVPASPVLHFVTYATLNDMLTDSNRTGTFTPPGSGPPSNLVGSDSDGTLYWSLFNFENETGTPASFRTYATLADMLTNTNVLQTISAGGLTGRFLVGTGSDEMRRGAARGLSEPAPALLAALGIALLAGFHRRARRR